MVYIRTPYHEWGRVDHQSLIAKIRRNSYRASDSDCVLWRGGHTDSGYPKTMWGRRTVLVSRALMGFPPCLVLHRCHNPACINKKHLKLGTHRTNMKERRELGRQARGEEHGRATMSELDVRRIRSDGRANPIIAHEHNVSTFAIWAIKNRRTWKHVD